MMRKLTSNNYQDIVRAERAAAVHFDADWDVAYRPTTRRLMSEAAEVLEEVVNFGEV